MKTRGKKAEATEASREKKKVKAVGKATKIKESKKIVNSIPKIDEPKKRIARKSTKITKQIVKVASKSTTTKQNSENSTPLAISKSPSCVVVYTTGDYEYFRTEAMARKQRSGLPGSLVKEYRLFPSKQEATQFMDATFEDKKPASRKSEPKIVTPTKVGDPNANLPIKALNKIGLSRLESINFPMKGSVVASKYNDLGPTTTVSSSHMVNLRKAANSCQVEIHFHIFKYVCQPQPNDQVVTFALYDMNHSKYYLTHH